MFCIFPAGFAPRRCPPLVCWIRHGGARYRSSAPWRRRPALPAVRRRTSFPCIAVNLLPQQDTGQGPCPARPWKNTYVAWLRCATASRRTGVRPRYPGRSRPRPGIVRLPVAALYGFGIRIAEDLLLGAGGWLCWLFAEGCRSHSERGEEARMLDLVFFAMESR